LDRFDFTFPVELPDGGARMKALSGHVADINPESAILQGVSKSTLEQLVSLTDGYSYREVEKLVFACIALRRGDRSLDGRHLVAAARYRNKCSDCLKGGRS
jgi:hypothetical protein